MIFEVRVFKGKSRKPAKIVKFTWWTCKGNSIGHADRIALRAGADHLQLLERHFQGVLATHNYGYGRGYEPICVGSV